MNDRELQSSFLNESNDNYYYLGRIYATKLGFELLDSTSLSFSAYWLVETIVDTTIFSFFD